MPEQSCATGPHDITAVAFAVGYHQLSCPPPAEGVQPRVAPLRHDPLQRATSSCTLPGPPGALDLMTKVTQLVGATLVAVGVVAYVATGFASVTALLPSVLGLVIGVLGTVAARIDAGQHAIHAALVVALLGLLGSLQPLGGLADAEPAAITSLVAVVVLTVYLALGVRSFVSARRASRR
jgi:hypothetical protein